MQLNEERPFIDLGVLSVESAEDYHAKAGDYLSSSMLRDFLISPDYFYRKQAGEVEGAESSSMLLGTATHVRILEGQAAYHSQFAFKGPINPQTNKPYGEKTQAWAQWQARQGKPILTDKMIDQVESMARSVSTNSDALELLCHGRSEGVVRAEYCGMPCQIRIDWLHSEYGIVDLKTTNKFDSIPYLLRKYLYHHQLAVRLQLKWQF